MKHTMTDTLALRWQHGASFAELMVCFRDDSYCLRVGDEHESEDLDLMTMHERQTSDA